MGSRKKLILAALVSTVMMLSFAIGFMPAQMENAGGSASAAAGASAVAISADGVTPLGDRFAIPVGAEQGFSALRVENGAAAGLIPNGEAEWSLATDGAAALSAPAGGLVATVTALAPGEAGLYVSTASGLVDLVDLTLYDLAAKSSKVLSAVTITQPKDGARIFYDDAETSLPLVATSTVNDPADAFLGVRYTYDGTEQTALAPPYAVTIPDVLALTTTSITAAAASYSEYDQNPGGGPQFSYTDTVNFTLVGLTNPDANGDGLLDDPFGAGMLPGDIYLSSKTLPGATGPRQVAIANIGDVAKQIDAIEIPAEGVTVSISDPNNPGRVVTVIAPAGLIQPDEEGFLILAVADTLTDLLGSGEVGDVAPEPGTLVTGGRYFEISILVKAVGADPSTATEIDPLRLADNPLALIVDGLDVLPGDNARFFTHPSDITNAAAPPALDITLTVSPGGAWAQIAEGSAVGAGQMAANISSSLSIFAPYLTPANVQITGVENTGTGAPSGFAAGGEQLKITLANANFGDTFTVNLEGSDIAPSNITDLGGGNVELTLTIPAATALPAPASSTDVNVRVDTSSGDFDVRVNGFTYLGPRIDEIIPNAGDEGGGEPVTVKGAGFEGVISADSVVFVDSQGGTTPLTNLVVSDAETISATTTAGTAGSVDVVVTLPNNYQGALADGFVYLPSAPTVTSVFPNRTPNDGGYTVRVGGSGFITPAKAVAGFTNVFFSAAHDQYSDSDQPAALLEVLDDTKMNVLTPAREASGMYSVYAANTTYGSANTKAGFFLPSNLVDFTFVDALATGMKIYQINPNQGPISGGNTIKISADPVPGTSKAVAKRAKDENVTADNVIVVGDTDPAVGATGHRVPVSLRRATGAVNAPATIDADFFFDQTVVEPASASGFSAAARLNEWYGKSVTGSTDVPGRIGIVVSGGTTEITTIDDQRDIDNTFEVENPFHIGDLRFNVIGVAGESTTITTGPIPAGLNMATGSAGNIPANEMGWEGGTLCIGGNCGVLPTPADLAEALTADDPPNGNGDGEVTPAELLSAFPGCDQACFDSFDTNGDGVLTAADAVACPVACTDALVADANADGQVTEAEFDAAFPGCANFADLDVNDDNVITAIDDCGLDVEVYFGVNPGVVVGVAEDVDGVQDEISVIVPAQEGYVAKAFGSNTVDVLVRRLSNPTLFAISAANSSYQQYDGGYTYLPGPSIDSVTPNKAWLFGGEVVEVKGGNFTGTTVVKFGATVAERDPSATHTANSIFVIVPPLANFTGGLGTQTVDVTVSDEVKAILSDTLTDGFTYVKFESSAGIYTTAFYFDAAVGSGDVDLALDNSFVLKAQLNVPQFQQGSVSTVFGIGRATTNPSNFATEQLGSDKNAKLIDGIWNFDIHLYDGAAPYSELSVDLTGTPATLSYPIPDGATLDGAPLTLADLQGAKASTYSNASDFDYTYAVQAFSATPGPGALQSVLQDTQVTENGGLRIVNSEINTIGTAYALIVVDSTPPVVTAIDRADASPTNAAVVNFTVTFSEPVTGVDAADFEVVAAKVVTGAVITGVTDNGDNSWNVAVSTGTGDGTLAINVVDDDSIVDGGNNPLGGPGAGNGNFSGPAYVIDKTAPVVANIALADANPTSAAVVNFTVTFSEAVTGVDAADFEAQGSKIVTPGPVGTPTTTDNITWNVPVDTGTGDGQLALKLVDDDSIIDVATNPLGGVGSGNGDLQGPAYVIDKTAPVVVSIALADANPTNAAVVNFTVTFSEAVTGVDAADFEAQGSKIVTPGSVGTPTTTDNITWNVPVDTGTGDGQLALKLVDDDSIIDAATNPLGGVGSGNGDFSGPAYVIDKTAPVVVSIALADANPTNAAVVNFTVTFSEVVINVDQTDFQPLGSKVVTPGPVGTPTTLNSIVWNVPVDTGTGEEGQLALDLVNDGSIVDQALNPLQAGALSPAYTVDKKKPTIDIVGPAASPIGQGQETTYTVTYEDADSLNITLTDDDISVVPVSGDAAAEAEVLSVKVTGERTIRVFNASGVGTLKVKVDAGTARDNAGNLADARESALLEVQRIEGDITLGPETDHAWMFGGVEVHISSTAPEFDENTQVFFGDDTTPAARSEETESDSQNIYVIAPKRDFTAETRVESIRVVTGAGKRDVTLAQPFTYVRVDRDRQIGASEGQTVTSTAFIVDTNRILGSLRRFDVEMPGTVGTGKLEIPRLNKGTLYGVARATGTPGLAGTDTDPGTPGTHLTGNLAFSVHLYEPAAEPGRLPTEIEETTSTEVGSLTYPLPDSVDLKVKDVLRGLLWTMSRSSRFAADVPVDNQDESTFEVPGLATLNRERPLTANDFSVSTPASEGVDDIVVRGAAGNLSEKDKRVTALRLRFTKIGTSYEIRDKIQGTEEQFNNSVRIGGTAANRRGPTSGGTTVIVNNSNDNISIAWPLGVTIGAPGAFGGKQANTAPVTEFLNLGENPLQLRFSSPQSPLPGDGLGRADILLEFDSGGAKQGPIRVILQNAFTYTQSLLDRLRDLLRALLTAAGAAIATVLGALVALIGLAAGGGGGGGGGPCFIATAAYGTPLAGEIEVLRALRDSMLLDNAVGTAFVDVYYRLSPALADLVAQYPALAAAVRVALLPVIALAKFVVAMPELSVALGALSALWVALRRRIRRQA